jgi:glycosyltransferase involved in cell wall biosynthesis
LTAQDAAPRPKIARIIARLNVGGPARHCWILGHGLAKRGFDTLLLTGHEDVGEVRLDPGRWEGPGLRLERVPGLGRPPAPKDDLLALWHLVRTLRRERPAIVHTHTAKGGALGRLAARLAGVPLVVHTFHGHVLSGYFGPVGSALAAVAERALARMSQRIITLSPALRDELLEGYRVGARERYEVIPLGRELEPFRSAQPGSLRAELSIGQGETLVGCVGRLVAIKRVPWLVEAFAPLSQADAGVHLVVIGDGPERGAVEAAIRRLGLEGRVHLLGWRSDLPRVYADLDLLALSSRNEGTPLAVIEAFAAGVPLVATAVGGLVDMLDAQGGAREVQGPPLPPGVALRAQGALVPPDDLRAMSDALRALVARADLREAASVAAQEASHRWEAERLVEDVARLYRNLLGVS